MHEITDQTYLLQRKCAGLGRYQDLFDNTLPQSLQDDFHWIRFCFVENIVLLLFLFKFIVFLKRFLRIFDKKIFVLFLLLLLIKFVQKQKIKETL